MPGKAQIWEKLRFGRAEQQANSLFCSETSPSTAGSPSCLASGASGGKSQDLSSTSLDTTHLTDSVAYCRCRLCICTQDLHWPLWGGMENRTKVGGWRLWLSPSQPSCWLPCPPVPSGELPSPAPHSVSRMKWDWMTALYFPVFRACINEICRLAH